LTGGPFRRSRILAGPGALRSLFRAGGEPTGL
jgi:hypothetical protein